MNFNLNFNLFVSALDLAQNSNVQDAFVIAVEQQARERLERLSALKRIKPVDMTKLSQQVSARCHTRAQWTRKGFAAPHSKKETLMSGSAGGGNLCRKTKRQEGQGGVSECGGPL